MGGEGVLVVQGREGVELISGGLLPSEELNRSSPPPLPGVGVGDEVMGVGVMREGGWEGEGVGINDDISDDLKTVGKSHNGIDRLDGPLSAGQCAA